MKSSKKRIVVKVGSSSLASRRGGIDRDKMSLLVSAISRLKAEGHETLLVSSGAVASGYGLLGYQQRPRTLVAKQAAAAIGQGLLMQEYTAMFARHGYTVAQILLTRSDFSDKERYHHAFETMSLLLAKGIIPIINENDTVSVTELTFGDNDMLGALVAGLVHADLYVIITDTDGLYDKDPRKHADARRIPFLPAVTDEAIAAAGDPGTLGTGGMRSKLIAARTALQLGLPCFIGVAKTDSDLLRIVKGEGEGTYVGGMDQFTGKTVPTRKQWIALHSPVNGQIHVDEGAAEAILHRSGSLLCAGIREVSGMFQAGEVVEVWADGKCIGRGISRFSADELRLVLKNNNRAFVDREVIHRDHWVPLMPMTESHSR